jgi:Tol biopolymer transport system component
MRGRIIQTVGIANVVLAGLLIAAASPAAASFPGDDGSIMYARWGPSFRGYGYFTIEPDGTQVEPVPFRFMEDASWSPDGMMFAYAAYLSSGPKIYVVDAATLDRTLVVDADDFPSALDYIGDVAFGPTGDRLVLQASMLRGASSRLYTVDVDGTDLTQISGDRELVSPDWSSTDRIVAGVYGLQRTKLITLDPDGTNVELLVKLDPTTNPELAVGPSPSWAPDGSAVTFTSQSDRRRADIWLVEADGSDPRRFTTTLERWEWKSVWSPSGDAIVVSVGGRNDTDTTDLWSMQIAGGRIRLTDTARLDEWVDAWRPVE